MSRNSILGAGLAFAALSAVGYASAPVRGEGQQRAKEREREKREAQPEPQPVAETRQQRRARERAEFKRLPRHA